MSRLIAPDPLPNRHTWHSTENTSAPYSPFSRSIRLPELQLRPTSILQQSAPRNTFSSSAKIPLPYSGRFCQNTNRPSNTVLACPSHGFVNTAGSYLSASDKRIHIGLGSATKVTVTGVLWPSGIKQTMESVRSNQVLVIYEPKIAGRPACGRIALSLME